MEKSIKKIAVLFLSFAMVMISMIWAVNVNAVTGHNITITGTGVSSDPTATTASPYAVEGDSASFTISTAEGTSVDNIMINGQQLATDGQAHDLTNQGNAMCTATYNVSTKVLSITNIAESAGDLGIQVSANPQSGGGGEGGNPPAAGTFKISVKGTETGTVSYSLDAGRTWIDVAKSGSGAASKDVDITGKTSIKLRATSDNFFDATLFDETNQSVKYGSYDDLLSNTGVNVNISDKKGYTFSAQYDNIKTIVWSYSKNNPFGDDVYVQHGKVAVLAINGAPVPNNGVDPNDPSGNTGYLMVTPGSKVTVKLIPDYGYQADGISLNGGATLAADKNTLSTFTFTMPETNIHFNAVFKPSNDNVNCTGSNIIESGTIQNGQNAAANGGNLDMTVKDNAAYDTDVTKVVTNGTNVTKVGSVDIALKNIVSQGDGNYWTNEVTEFDNNIVVDVKMDDTTLAANETYAVVRDHEGTLTELDSEYNATTGELSFPTNQFSTYTIVKKTVPKGTTTTTTTTTSTPKTGDGSMMIPYAVMLAISAAALIGLETARRRNRKNDIG